MTDSNQVSLSGTIVSFEPRVSKSEKNPGNPWIKAAIDVGGVIKSVSIIGPDRIAAVGPLAAGASIVLAGEYDRGDAKKSFLATGLAGANLPAAAAPQATTPRAQQQQAAPVSAANANAPVPSTETLYPFTGTVSKLFVGVMNNADKKPYARFTFVYTSGGKTLTRTAMAFGKGYENIKAGLKDGATMRLLCRHDTKQASATQQGGQSLVVLSFAPTAKAA